MSKLSKFVKGLQFPNQNVTIYTYLILSFEALRKSHDTNPIVCIYEDVLMRLHGVDGTSKTKRLVLAGLHTNPTHATAAVANYRAIFGPCADLVFV